MGLIMFGLKIVPVWNSSLQVMCGSDERIELSEVVPVLCQCA